MKGSKVFRTTGVKGGMDRSYKKPYPVEAEIPTVHELMANPEHNFIKSFASNAEGLVWKTRQKVNLDNYRAFIYAMAMYALLDYNPNWDPDAWQFHHNLRKLRNKMKNKHILVSGPEKLVMDYMLGEMKKQSKASRLMFLGSMIKDLERRSAESSACG